jgi:hypothetical protein
MVGDDGQAVLMDFGSTIKRVQLGILVLTFRARIHVLNRQQALLEQDIAAEHSTMPFRAPELFDVKNGKTLDEKVDIWVRSSRCPCNDPADSLVPWLHAVRRGVWTLAVRGGWSISSDGSKQRAVSTPRRLLRETSGTHRCHARRRPR